MTVKLKMTCRTCGSTDVGRDAWAEWDYEAQQWVLRGDPFDDAYCFNCDTATKLEEEEIVPDRPTDLTEANRFIHQKDQTNGTA